MVIEDAFCFFRRERGKGGKTMGIGHPPYPDLPGESHFERVMPLHQRVRALSRHRRWISLRRGDIKSCLALPITFIILHFPSTLFVP